MNFKEIHIGKNIQDFLIERDISTASFSKRMQISESALLEIIEKPSIDTQTLLKISQLLKFDFFRPYSMNLMLYRSATTRIEISNNNPVPHPKRRKKNLYTPEVIAFIISEVKSNNYDNIWQVRDKYGIPRTTFDRWIKKYG